MDVTDGYMDTTTETTAKKPPDIILLNTWTVQAKS